MSRAEPQGGDKRTGSPSSAAQSPSFLVGLGHRQLGRRHRLEALVGDRLSTLDRKAVGSGHEALLGPLDCGELFLQNLPPALVKFVLQQLSPEVTCVELIRFGRGALVRVDEPGEIALDPLPFGGEKLTGSSRIHGLSVTCRGRTYHGKKIFVDGGPTCSRTSASRGRPSDDPGELIGGDSGVRPSGRAEPRRLGSVGLAIGSSLVVGAVV